MNCGMTVSKAELSVRNNFRVIYDSFSSSFEKNGRRLKGLYDERLSGGLTKFGNYYYD
jgi:hypothetical protein